MQPRRGRALRPIAALLAAASALVLAAPASAAPVALPGWHVTGAQPRAASAVELSRAPALRLGSERGGGRLIQTLAAPSAPLQVSVRGRLRGGRALLRLDWRDQSGARVARRERPLVLRRDGLQTERFSVRPAGAARLSVTIVARRGASLDVHAVSALASGRELLRDPALELVGCRQASLVAESPGRVAVPGWSPRYTSMQVSGASAPRAGENVPLSVRSPRGASGIQQSTQAPRGPVDVSVEGRRSGGAQLLVDWVDGYGSASERQVLERAYPLTLPAGRQSVRAQPPPNAERYTLLIAVVGDESGRPVVIERVAARSHGRMLLVNPELAPVCIRPFDPPAAARELPLGVRLALTLAALALVAGLLAGAWRRWSPAFGDVPGPAMERWLLVGIALMPLVSLGTVKLGLRIVPADWILSGLGAVVLIRRRGKLLDDLGSRAVPWLLTMIVLVATVSTAIGVLAYSDVNLAGLPSRSALVADIGIPRERAAIEMLHLLQGVLAVIAVLGVIRTPAVLDRALRVVVGSGLALAAYGTYEVVAERALGHVPKLLPGVAFPYPGLLRASGTFPEPTAYGGFMVFAAACAIVVWQRDPRRRWLAALAMIVAAALVSRSTVAVSSLVVLIGVVALLRQRRILVGLLAVALAGALAMVVVAGPGRAFDETFAKPFKQDNSALDRRTTWGTGIEMGLAYAPLGVGRGQFAYNAAPFLGEDDVNRAGRAQSGAVEIWAETGPVGLALALSLLLLAAARLGRRPLAMARSSSGGFALAVLTVALGVVMLTYYTTTYVWPWVALGVLLAIARDLPAGGVRSAPAAARAPASAASGRAG